MKDIFTESSAYVIKSPPSSGWICHLFGEHSPFLTWEPAEGRVPNWWVRFWMRVFFGSVWKRKGAL
jgi:hypothetical protein